MDSFERDEEERSTEGYCNNSTKVVILRMDREREKEII